MRYKLVILFIALQSLLTIQAQNTIQEVNKILNDDERYNAAKVLLEYYLKAAPDSLLIFAEKLNTGIRDEKFRALKEFAYAEYYNEIYELGISLNHAIEAIFIYEKFGKPDILILSKLYNLAGLCSEQLFRYEKALEYYEKGIELAQEISDKYLLADLYSNRSFAYYGMGDFGKAISNLEIAYELNKEIKDTGNIAKDLNNLGFIYTSWGKYDIGIECYQKALEYSLQKGLQERTAISCNNIGMSYFQQEKYGLAEEYILRALEIDLEIGLHHNVAKRYNNLGLVYFQQGKVERSITHLGMAAQVFLEKGDSINYAKSIINIADTYFKTGRNDEAFKYLDKGYKISLGTNSLPLIEHNTGKMFQYYKSVGDYKQALEYKELYDEFSDSLYSIESAKVVEELQTLYETEKKEVEIGRLNTESELKEDIIKKKNQQKNLLAAFVVLLLLVLIAIVLISIRIRKQRRELEKLNTVKNRLFAIISHDLRGYSCVFQDAGMVIRHHLKKENFDKVNSISENLEISAISYSSQLDNILSWSTFQLNGYQFNPESFKPFEACNLLMNNLSISHKLKGNKFNNNIEPNLLIDMDKGAFSIIIGNLLANANKFTEQGTISVGLDKLGKGIKLIVSDTGVGMSNEIVDSILHSETVHSQRGTRGETGSGVGLGLVKTFVKLAGGKMLVESEPGNGSKFIIVFPNQ